MTTLKIALAQSPHRAAEAQTANGVIEVRALMVDRASGQRTWTSAWRYELLTNNTPQLTGSYTEMTEFASYLRVAGCELDWQPIYERVTRVGVAKGVH